MTMRVCTFPIVKICEVQDRSGGGVCRGGFPGQVDVAAARGSSVASLVALLEDELRISCQSDCSSFH